MPVWELDLKAVGLLEKLYNFSEVPRSEDILHQLKKKKKKKEK